MTHFFATPEETQLWVDAEIQRLGLLVHDELLPGGSHRCFLWPLGALAPDRARGVLVHFPSIHEDTLTMGVTGWKGSALPEPAATQGQRLNRQLTRSLRKLATVPVFAISYDGKGRSAKPDAWATPTVASSGMSLR